mmetsp:Transcript_9108/g.22606  ORF Transcript_9108/g.22606 Transcript_9108/m.22606 type:complete len:206 (+) Transcript_9108:156-773(+)
MAMESSLVCILLRRSTLVGIRSLRSFLQAEPAAQKDARIPHAVDQYRRPQVLALGIDGRPGPAQHTEGQKSQLGLMVDGKQNAAHKHGQRIVPQLQDQSREQKASVQNFLPPGCRQAGSNVSDNRRQEIGALRVDELGNDGIFFGLFQNGNGKDVRVEKVGNIEKPRAHKVTSDRPPHPLGMPRLLRRIVHELFGREFFFHKGNG